MRSKVPKFSPNLNGLATAFFQHCGISPDLVTLVPALPLQAALGFGIIFAKNNFFIENLMLNLIRKRTFNPEEKKYYLKRFHKHIQTILSVEFLRGETQILSKTSK
jgi:hypothetical protein